MIPWETSQAKIGTSASCSGALALSSHRELMCCGAGIGTLSLGHCHPNLVRAVSDQAAKLIQGQQNQFLSNTAQVPSPSACLPPQTSSPFPPAGDQNASLAPWRHSSNIGKARASIRVCCFVACLASCGPSFGWLRLFVLSIGQLHLHLALIGDNNASPAGIRT